MKTSTKKQIIGTLATGGATSYALYHTLLKTPGKFVKDWKNITDNTDEVKCFNAFISQQSYATYLPRPFSFDFLLYVCILLHQKNEPYYDTAIRFLLNLGVNLTHFEAVLEMENLDFPIFIEQNKLKVLKEELGHIPNISESLKKFEKSKELKTPEKLDLPETQLFHIFNTLEIFRYKQYIAATLSSILVDSTSINGLNEKETRNIYLLCDSTYLLQDTGDEHFTVDESMTVLEVLVIAYNIYTRFYEPLHIDNWFKTLYKLRTIEKFREFFYSETFEEWKEYTGCQYQLLYKAVYENKYAYIPLLVFYPLRELGQQLLFENGKLIDTLVQQCARYLDDKPSWRTLWDTLFTDITNGQRTFSLHFTDISQGIFTKLVGTTSVEKGFTVASKLTSSLVNYWGGKKAPIFLPIGTFTQFLLIFQMLFYTQEFISKELIIESIVNPQVIDWVKVIVITEVVDFYVQPNEKLYQNETLKTIERNLSEKTREILRDIYSNGNYINIKNFWSTKRPYDLKSIIDQIFSMVQLEKYAAIQNVQMHEILNFCKYKMNLDSNNDSFRLVIEFWINILKSKTFLLNTTSTGIQADLETTSISIQTNEPVVPEVPEVPEVPIEPAAVASNEPEDECVVM